MAQSKYEVGDVIKMKKKHPCGSFEWEILRVGADFRLKCQGRTSDYELPGKLWKKYKRNNAKRLENQGKNGIVSYCDILFILVPGTKDREPKDHKEVQAT